ncbi:hypothetical protein D554_1607 [Bordetella holmesii 30539]|uniref:Uncharacterized protein n=2 Tax=Bordetella holmesii TaxID=35814 RepID=A0A158M9S2_9BORD|nr:hypothetical protein D560_2157 [Bordetella holmesii ATCC 51541]EWM43601.1 hypothetical protein D556_2149 [Bordetella holmesii 41130]EWM47384.1 hypothetical protein D555_2175 [Bordetella holmesii 35009]EWM51544.1 hypothetical protein D557_1405 [Bordetella holmesii 70147]EXF88788.1 hypothetical protein D554_1607 [Bordetella holmesii 30539]EXX92871.1 hypothetical protein D559_0257 [Bordetella holmesii 1058]KAK70951.1 hypothetical protein L573_2540 [Bordetella holmesii H620]KAK81004.1 hypothe
MQKSRLAAGFFAFCPGVRIGADEASGQAGKIMHDSMAR